MATISELMKSVTNIVPNTQSNINIPQYTQANIERFKDQPEIANQFKALGSLGSGMLDNARDNIINAYNVFEESTNPAFRNYMQTSLSEWNKILWDIDKQRKQAESFYWPWGQAEKMINDYVVKYWDRIAQQAAGNQALAKNIGIRSWASQSAVRAGVSQQQALDADNLIKFQEKKVWDLTNLYNTYNNLISTLRAEASWANQQFILQPLATMLERQSNIASALVNNEAQLNQMKMQLATAWNSSSSWLDPMWLLALFMQSWDNYETAANKVERIMWWNNNEWTNIDINNLPWNDIMNNATESITNNLDFMNTNNSGGASTWVGSVL